VKATRKPAAGGRSVVKTTSVPELAVTAGLSVESSPTVIVVVLPVTLTKRTTALVILFPIVVIMLPTVTVEAVDAV